MRVLTVGNMYPPQHLGGYELVWQAAVAHLRAQGDAVRVLTTDADLGAAGAEDDDVHRELRWYWRAHEIVRPGPLHALRIERHNQAVLRAHLARFRPDVVAWWSMGAMSLALLEAVRRRGIPAVAFVHDDWLGYAPLTDGWQRRVRRAPRLAARLTGVPSPVDLAAAAHHVFVSDATRRRARQAGVAADGADVAHSGIAPAFLAAAAERAWDWRLLYVGRIDERKGIGCAVEALGHLPAQARLTVVGSGDQQERERLERRAAELGAGARVVFAGSRGRHELPAVYAAADAVVFPVAWDEPWGLVPLEAMGVGRPVLATGRGGSGEYLQDGVNCLLFEAGDAPGLAAAVRRLADDPPLRERLRSAGRATAAAHTQERFHVAVEAALRRAASRAAG